MTRNTSSNRSIYMWTSGRERAEARVMQSGNLKLHEHKVNTRLFTEEKEAIRQKKPPSKGQTSRYSAGRFFAAVALLSQE
jgi:hypothetical protein